MKGVYDAKEMLLWRQYVANQSAGQALPQSAMQKVQDCGKTSQTVVQAAPFGEAIKRVRFSHGAIP